VPHTADSYVHRVGRTGRAEAAGTAITLVAPDELPTLHAIEKSIDIYIDKPEPPSPAER
jgi:ATP-dependent RNA helicase DeaD